MREVACSKVFVGLFAQNEPRDPGVPDRNARKNIENQDSTIKNVTLKKGSIGTVFCSISGPFWAQGRVRLSGARYPPPLEPLPLGFASPERHHSYLALSVISAVRLPTLLTISLLGLSPFLQRSACTRHALRHPGRAFAIPLTTP